MKIQMTCLLALLAFPLVSLAAPTPTTEMKQVLDALKDRKGKPIETLSATEARKQPTPADATMDIMKKKEGKVIPLQLSMVEDREIDGAAGKISARVYTPEGKRPLPVIVYYHGGGFVIATNDTYDASARAIAKQTQAIVVAVEYRKAPEHKFPAAHDDAYAAYQWVVKNATVIGGDPRKVAVAGESAGANLALNVAVKARDDKFQLPIHELLVYPVASNDMNSESYKTNAKAAPLNKPMMEWFMKNYTRTPADAKDTRLNLLGANFKGLNPATIITAEIDPLMTEGEKLSTRMKEQGVNVEYKNFNGVTHEFFGMAPVVPQAKEAQSFAADNLKDSFKM